MRVFHSDRFTIPLPAGHRFPITKYRRLREALAALDDPRLRFETAPAVSRGALATVHSPAYVDRVFDGTLGPAELRALGFPWSSALVERSRRSVGATLAALEAALDEGVAVTLAGGTHHAFRDRGAGFCVFNDVAAAAVAAGAGRPGTRVLVVDCDVHQGDGTAEILSAVDGAYTFSIHAARNYPHRKPCSDLDIALPDGTGDARYLAELERGLGHALHAARPDVVLMIAGADVYHGDRLGRLALSTDGIAERDRLVCAAAAGANAALVVVMGGGYADDIEAVVGIHLSTVLCAADSWAARRGGGSAREPLQARGQRSQQALGE